MDSSVGRSVLVGVGVGRTRHLAVTVVWAQDQTRSGRVEVEKCEGARDVSDIGTTPLGASMF